MKLINFFIYIIPSIGFGQLIESGIPFYLNSDNDGQINVVDTDDDNDGFLDNDDAYPLNASLNSQLSLTVDHITLADAGLRNNSNNNANTNYGLTPLVETKNVNRSIILKFDQPQNVEITAATLTLKGDSEDDELEVYFLPYHNWDESTITYNNTDFSGNYLIGTMSPVNGIYTFQIPMFALPDQGQNFSLWIYDPGDPGNNTEALFTKESVGNEPTITYTYFQPEAPRLDIDGSTSKSVYVDGGTLQVGLRLSQAPTSMVWVPIELSNTVADLIGDQVITFDQNNWNTYQYITIDPSQIGAFDVILRPLHSDDAFYNGHNPDDLIDFRSQAVDLTNLAGWAVDPCDTFALVLDAIPANEGYRYKILSGPSGLNVFEKTGQITFRPLSNQIDSTYNLTISITNQEGITSEFSTQIEVANGTPCDPTGYYVDYNAEDNPTPDGSPSSPFHDIVAAVQYAAANGGGAVYVRGVEHQLTSIIELPYQGPSNNPIVIQPAPGEHVKFNFSIRSAFELPTGSRNIEINGFEIDGGTDELDFWCIVAQALYGDESIPRGGGICINVDGDSITVRNNYLHDAYQKAIEIRSARYLDAVGNIIHHIATTSLSGGHGIMRQQKGDEFFDADNLNDYRWDINSNLIYNVQQRIYSWVPSKNFMEMVLDEGKPILIDDPKDTDGIPDTMKARIINNIIAFGSIDHIRLKSTPNLEVIQNSIYTQSTHADGITDRSGDTPTPQFINFTCLNNAVQTEASRTSIEVDNAIDEANNHPNSSPTISGNYGAGGGVRPVNYPGLNPLGNVALFVNPDNGNFRINPALGLPSNTGVDVSIIEALEQRAAKFGADIVWDGWINDDMILTQTILDNIPNAYDGIANNETVFTDYGVFNSDTSHLEFQVVNGTWKADNEITSNHHEFRLNHDYASWMRYIMSTFVNDSNQPYQRARWGNSYVKQDFIFPENWLTVSTFYPDTHTVIRGYESDFHINGDLLVDFDGVTPSPGDYFDIIAANSISTDVASIFDYVQFTGYTPADYSLSIINVSDHQVVRLTIGNAGCQLNVTNTSNNEPGSLRAALACALDGDTITLDAILLGDTIKLTGEPVVIDKEVTILGTSNPIWVENCTDHPIELMIDKTIALESFNIISDSITNNAQLHCTGINFHPKTVQAVHFSNSGGASVYVNGQVLLD